MDEVKGGGRHFFAGTTTLSAEVLNGIRNFAPIDSAIAAFSIWGGGEFGPGIGIFGPSISPVGALPSMEPGAARRRAPGWG